MDDVNISREDKIPQFKLAIVQYIVLAIFLVLGYGLWRLQVLGSDKFETLAEHNRVREIPILAPRGRIFDRNGRVIVDNYPSFSVLLLRDQKRDLVVDIPEIAQGLGMNADDLRTRIRKATQVGAPLAQPIVLKDDITPSDLAFVEAHRLELPELETIMVHRRLYPRNGFAAHLIGYVGEVSEDMLNSPQYELYEPGMIVGKSGVEKFYNDMLMGKDGSRRIEVDSRGREIRRLSDSPAIPGKPLRLTLDLDVQIAAEQALGDRNGAIIVLDPHNGDVLAMVSRPVFDPNQFAVRISGKEWSKLVKDEGKPLLNKAIQAQLAPGSVFKIIMSVAGLQEGIAQTLHVNCPGGATFYGRYFKCWVTFEHRVHGPVEITKAIYQSCDVFFYTLAERLGIGKIAEYATRLGLGKKTGIDLYDEASGVMPSEEWKIKNFKQKWYPGETISVGIGQGAITVTPIQLTRAIAAIATDGLLVRPHVAMFDALPPEFKQAALKQVNQVQLPFDRRNWETITDAMARVPTPEGTAGASHIQDVDFAGKTGSAQVVSLTTRAKFEHKTEFAQNSWFVGFAPRRNPDIVVGVLFEGGEHGKLAARMAAQVIRAYVERERTKALELKRAAAPGTNPTLGPDRFTPPKQAVQKKPEVNTVAEKQTAAIDFTGVWHDESGDAADAQKLSTGSFRVRVNPAATAAAAKSAPGVSP